MKKQKEPKEKKVREKKPKKPKEPKKSKKGQAPEGEQGEKKKKKKNPLKLLILLVLLLAAAAAAVYFFVLKDKGGDDPNAEASEQVEEPQPPELPEELKVGEESVVGMALGADESEAQAVLAKTVTYTYTNLNDAGAAASTYAKQLAAAEAPFSVVDDSFVRTDAPDYTASEGTVLLARNLPKPEDESGSSQEEGQEETPKEPAVDMVLTVKINWSQGECVVTADEAEGKVTSPPRQTSGGAPGASMGMTQAQDYIQSLPPSMLGLSGETMDAYEVMPIDGVVIVDDVACTRINVYNENNSQNSSEFMGSYLVSIDGNHLYRLNPHTNEVEKLK